MDIFLANVGQRDLYLDGSPLDPKTLRQMGEKIRRNYQDYKDRLSAPILKPGIEHARLMNNDRPLSVILFVSDQEDPRYREGDTIGCGRVLSDLLPSLFPGIQVSLMKMVRGLTRVDEMLNYYRNCMETAKEFKEGFEMVFASCSGGIPGCNMALLWAVIEKFRDRAYPILVEEGGRAISLGIGKEILERFRKEVAQALAQRYDFAGLAALYRNVNQEKCLLAEAAHCRLNLDLEGARRALAELSGHPSPDRDFYLELEQYISELPHETKNQVIELYHNALIKWDKGEYLDFLGRVFRIMEASLRLLCGEWRIPTDETHAPYKEFNEAINNCPGLRDFLREHGVDQPGVNTKTMMAILKFKEEGDQRLKAVRQILEGLESLITLRHKSVLGHEFGGASQKIITKAYKGEAEALFADLKNLVGQVSGTPMEENPFDVIRNKL